MARNRAKLSYYFDKLSDDELISPKPSFSAEAGTSLINPKGEAESVAQSAGRRSSRLRKRHADDMDDQSGQEGDTDTDVEEAESPEEPRSSQRQARNCAPESGSDATTNDNMQPRSLRRRKVINYYAPILLNEHPNKKTKKPSRSSRHRRHPRRIFRSYTSSVCFRLIVLRKTRANSDGEAGQ